MHLLYLFAISGLLCISYVDVFGQQVFREINGFVVDGSTTAPLDNVHVINVNRVKGAVSHSDGYFFIDAHIGDTVRFTRVGYKTIQKTIGLADSILIVELEMDVTQLPAAEVKPMPNNINLLRQDLLNRRVETRVSLFEKQMERAGFKRPPDNPIPPPPKVINPISFLYEKVFKKIQERKKKAPTFIPDLDYEQEED